MDDPSLHHPPEPALEDLKEQVRSLRHVLNLVLIAALITTAGVSLFFYRQTSLMKRQIDARQAALIESQTKERVVVLKGIEVFRQYGARDPVYASNILARFGLTPAPPTNAPVAPAPAKR